MVGSRVARPSADMVRTAASWIGQVIAWSMILSVCAVLLVAVLVPRVAGATPYTVLTGSMRPGMPPGTLVVVRPTDPARIAVGSVVTYQLESGKPAVVTHRVVSQGLDADGQPVFQTRGDANDSPDPKWVMPVQLKGEKWYSVPYLGYVNNAIDGSQRQMAVYVVAGALLAWAAYLFTSAARDRHLVRGSTT